MANPIMMGLLGAAGGAADARNKELQDNADDLRKRSYARLLHEYNVDQALLQQRLGIQLADHNQKAADTSEQKRYERNRTDALMDETRQNQNALDLYEQKAIIDDTYKGDEITGKFRQLSDIYGEDEAKKLLRGGLMDNAGSNKPMSQSDAAKLRKDAYEKATEKYAPQLARAENDAQRLDIEKKIEAEAATLFNQWANSGNASGDIEALVAKLKNEADAAARGDKNKTSANAPEKKSDPVEAARKRVAMAQANGREPTVDDLALIQKAKQPRKKTDREQRRRDEWEKRYPGVPYPGGN